MSNNRDCISNRSNPGQRRAEEQIHGAGKFILIAHAAAAAEVEQDRAALHTLGADEVNLHGSRSGAAGGVRQRFPGGSIG